MSVTHNTPAVMTATDRTKRAFDSGARNACRSAARAVQNHVRAEIPSGRGRSAGLFPGYAASGTLRGSMVADEPRRIPGAWASQVHQRSGTRADKYARIHHEGGIIRAKAGGWLRFPVPPANAPRSAKIAGNRAFVKDGFVFAKAVRIRRKQYFVTGVRNAVKVLPQVIRVEIVREVRT